MPVHILLLVELKCLYSSRTQTKRRDPVKDPGLVSLRTLYIAQFISKPGSLYTISLSRQIDLPPTEGCYSHVVFMSACSESQTTQQSPSPLKFNFRPSI
jgi:hypothetical protein